MATFMMLGKYCPSAMKEMSPQRTEKALALISKHGGGVECMYATLGASDLVFILTFPGVEEAMKAAVALGEMTGIAFTTSPALPIVEFDNLMSG